MTVQLGLLLALGCAFATNLAFLWKHKGAVAAPDVDIRHPLRKRDGPVLLQVVDDRLLASRSVAWVLHVAALALRPISLVQAVISGRPRVPRRARGPLVRLRAGQARVDGRGADRRRPGVPRLHGADRLDGLALELLDLRDDRLRGRDGLHRRRCSCSRTGSSASASPPRPDARRRGRNPVRRLRHLDQGADRHGAGRLHVDPQPLDAGRARSPRSPPSTRRPAAFRSARASR